MGSKQVFQRFSFVHCEKFLEEKKNTHTQQHLRSRSKPVKQTLQPMRSASWGLINRILKRATAKINIKLQKSCTIIVVNSVQRIHTFDNLFVVGTDCSIKIESDVLAIVQQKLIWGTSVNTQELRRRNDSYSD